MQYKCGVFGCAVMAVAGVWAGAAGPMFDAYAFGARGDGTRLATHALQSAIDAAAQAGGGTVRLGEGTYVSGTL